MMSALERIMVGKLSTKKINGQSLTFAIRNSKAASYFIKTVGEYGLQKPFFFSNPLYLEWNFTYKCNLKCKHCCFQDIDSKELTLKEKFDVVDQAVEADCVYFTFSGKEPLMSKDFFKVVEYAKNKNFFLRLVTNGTLLTKNVAKKLSQFNFDMVCVSIDSANKETHEKMRGKGTFYKAIRGIKNCIKEKIPVAITSTLTKLNYMEINEIVDLAKRLGASYVTLMDFLPVGRGSENKNLELSPEIKYEVLKKFIKRSMEEKNIELFIKSSITSCILRDMLESENSNFGTIFGIGTLIESKQELHIHSSGCKVGTVGVSIDPNGDIRPCYFLNIPIGNIKKDRIIDVWKNSEILKSLRTREDLKGNCGTCKDKYICGGCRTRALAYFNDLKAPDPGCIKNVELWNKFHLKR
jgi:radical SAM protein with 4Fe4S-binding SPASM domain